MTLFQRLNLTSQYILCFITVWNITRHSAYMIIICSTYST